MATNAEQIFIYTIRLPTRAGVLLGHILHLLHESTERLVELQPQLALALLLAYTVDEGRGQTGTERGVNVVYVGEGGWGRALTRCGVANCNL